MAVDAPLVAVEHLVALKAETTTGTPETLTGSEADALAFFDVDMQIESELTERPQEHAAGQLPGVPGGTKGSFTARSEFYGSGSSPSPTPSWAATLLGACAFPTSSNVAKEAVGSASYTSLTIAVNKDGARQSIAGATGTFTITGSEPGQPVSFNWTFSGVGQAEAAESLLAYTPPTVIPPRWAGAAFTIGGTVYKIASFELDAGLTIAYRQDGNKTAGYHSTVPTNARPVFRCQIEMPALSAHDFAADYQAGTRVAISLAIGATAGNILTIALPAAQLRMWPKKTTVEGIVRLDLEYLATRSSADHDSVTLTFG